MDEPVTGDELTGRQLGSFKLLRRLGQGGMGAVFLAQHSVIGSQVAVKVLNPVLASDPTILARFRDEARAVNLIGHENILRIYDLCQEGDLHYLIMEYLEGRPLSRVPLPVVAERAIPILAQICDALAAAHERGVVHRDLKPENVFLIERPGRAPFVKLLDFGVAKLLQDTRPHTAVGMVVGTPAYMAPEQFRGEPLDGRTDLYSLGVLSYLLSTGELPFKDTHLAALMHAHLATAPAPPHVLRPAVGQRWSEITLRAMAKRREERHQDARQLRADLLSALDLPEPRRALTTPIPPVTPRASRVSFQVDVMAADGTTLCTASGMELSKDGIFLSAPDFVPPLFSTLRLTIRGKGGTSLRLECEVVRLVNAAQAQAWGMSEGVGVQFTRRTDAQRQGLAALLRGEPIPSDTPVTPAGGVPADAEVVLASLRARVTTAGADPYRLLDVPANVDASRVRERVRELRRALRACLSPQGTPGQRVEAEALLDRIARAAQSLTDPARRAELDAARGNFAGVAQAIACGLTVTELEELRREFHAGNPRAASCAVVEVASARAYEEQEDLESAVRSYERALRHDPLDLMVHQRLSRLRLQAAKASTPGPEPGPVPGPTGTGRSYG